MLAICENEGIKRFEELELGPILKHPLVVHYFSIGPDVTEICMITTEQIVAYLIILTLRRKNTIIVDDLLEFIAKKRKKNRENLCIRIQSLGYGIIIIIIIIIFIIIFLNYKKDCAFRVALFFLFIYLFIIIIFFSSADVHLQYAHWISHAWKAI